MMTDRKIIASANVASEIANKLNASAAFVYLMIIGHRNWKTGECYLTQATLAEEVGMNDRTIRRHLTALKEAGFIEWKQGSSFSSKANSYIFLKEIFDVEGKGEAIEAKKLKAKNKEQKIKENASKKNECKVIQMPLSKKVPVSSNHSKIPSVPPKYKPQAKEETVGVKKEKDKTSTEIKTLLNEYKSLLERYNEMIETKENHWTDTYSDAVKNLIEKGNIENALNILNYAIKELKDCIKFKEKKAEKERKEKEFNERISIITLEEALKVYNTLKQELTQNFVRMVEERWLISNNPDLAKGLVINVKKAVEMKGLEFDLNKILA